MTLKHLTLTVKRRLRHISKHIFAQFRVQAYIAHVNALYIYLRFENSLFIVFTFGLYYFTF